jgi:hypothetical protein
MTRTVPALLAAASLATATGAGPTTAQERCLGCGIGGLEYPIAPPGYVYYPYGEPLPGANCSWFRVPAYDAYGLARPSSGVLLLAIWLSSLAAALIVYQPFGGWEWRRLGPRGQNAPRFSRAR